MCRSGIEWRVFALLALFLCLGAVPARAGQLGSLISPGPLTKAHAALEGAGKCQQCHEAGRRVTAARCLTCHAPIAERIQKGVGIHRAVRNECVSCHVEHNGADADMRHIDRRTFNHALETGFALAGQHAGVAANCVACHKARSFLDAKTTCVSCHTDVHKAALGTDCARCHSTAVPFKEARAQFDHQTARFQLTGAHQSVACVKCHKPGPGTGAAAVTATVFRGLDFKSCASCHNDPHEKKFGTTCTSCHVTDKWTTRNVDHARTAFPLKGAHAAVACVKCHQAATMTSPVKFDRCTACHVNVHRDSVKEDCKSCHTETTFKGAAFDHGARTSFALDGKHAGLMCRACHTNVSASDVALARKVIDYSGARRECVACHADKDPHKGEFGRNCESCHRPSTFAVKDFKHPRAPDFYAGNHETVACVKCHVPAATASVKPAAPSMDCVSCHKDVHLGQLGASCESCHAVSGTKFAAVNFAHERTTFALTGKHGAVACAACHKTETRRFPSSTGAAIVFKPVETTCQSCHKDPHLGQVKAQCDTCHVTATFDMPAFKHEGMDDFFGGFHGGYACVACHKKETGQFPAGRGTAVRLTVGRACAACHKAF